MNGEVVTPDTEVTIGCVHRAWIGYDPRRERFGLWLILRQKDRLLGTVHYGERPIEVSAAEEDIDEAEAEERRDAMLAGALRQANQLLRLSGRQAVHELAGVPVRVELERSGALRSWRLLIEAL